MEKLPILYNGNFRCHGNVCYVSQINTFFCKLHRIGPSNMCVNFRSRFPFLAPPAEWQRSFSNADSSVVVCRRRLSSSVVNFSLKWLISQKWPDNFFSFLAWSFLRKVLMYCKNRDLVESS